MTASQALQAVMGGAFALLGILTSAEWLRHRDRGRRFLALSTALLGLVALLDGIIAIAGDPTGAINDVVLVLFMFSGWAFLRFRDTLLPLGPRLRRLALVITLLTSAVLLAAYIPMGGRALPGVPQTIAALLLLVVWGTFVAEPVVRFWRESTGLPAVQRARLRSLVAAYGGIVLVLVLSVGLGLTNAGDAAYRAVYLAALPVVPLFYVAFAPPKWLRRFWREREEEPFRQALNRLLLYSPDRQTLAERCVEWAARLVGAEAAIVATDDGDVLAAHGLDRDSAWETVRELEQHDDAHPGGGSTQHTGKVITVRLRSQYVSGVIAVRAGPFTPLYGQDEVDRLREYASSLTTAMDRVLLVERLRRSAELLDLAYNPIITWDATSGEITFWNRSAEQLYGYSADEALGQVSTELLRSELPRPRQEILEVLRRRGRWDGEIGLRTKSGGRIVVSARWALQVDAAGRPAQVLEINRDITEERRVAAELREARDEAQRASAAKSEYLSRMSHELRTPLTAILGYSDLLELRDPREDQAEAVTAIQAASSHLLSLVNDVLDIARIESGRESLVPEPVSVRATLDECLRLIQPAARQRHVTVSRQLNDLALEHVSADRQRLVQVVLNLLSNAVKYSGDGARVEISVMQAGTDRIRIAVSDTGPGLSAELQERLFQPFDRLGAERTTTPGTGLGLALTKKLVEAMDGSISVTSAPGRGCTFTVELLRVSGAVVEPVSLNGSHAAVSVPPGERRTVLYVEDNLATIGLMEEIFAMRPQIQLITAMQGSLALELARQHRPDLVVLDLHLPDVTGDTVLRQLRETPATAEIPVVMFSADATERQVKRLLGLGARAYLLKPAKVTDFLSMLDEVLFAPPVAAG